MKVLICIPCLLTGGTEIQTLSLVRALVRGGHEVTTVCYFEHADDMKKRFENAGSAVALLCADGTRPKGVMRTAWTLFVGLRRVVSRWKPDVAHVQYMAPGALPIILLRLSGVGKVIATAHTAADIYSPGGLKLLRFLQRHVLAAFTCITERAERSFFGTSSLFSPKTHLAKRGNHFTIYNNLSDCISPAVHPRQSGEPFTIGVVSRLDHIKGMDLVVPAFARVRERHRGVSLLVVGDGSLRQQMEADTQRYHLEDAVEFTGRKPQEQLQEYYDRIDILLMPSRSEGFGLTAIEGMARGCVVVASDTGGLPEVVTDGETGLLHRPESVDDLAEKVLTLLHYPPERMEKMSEAAVKRSAIFNSARYEELTKAMYKQIEEL